MLLDGLYTARESKRGNLPVKWSFLVNCLSQKRGLIVKGKTRIEIEREILAEVEKEMQKPRLTESVRNGLSAQAAQAAKMLPERCRAQQP